MVFRLSYSPRYSMITRRANKNSAKFLAYQPIRRGMQSKTLNARMEVTLPQLDSTDPSDKILTGAQAAKRLGLPLSTVRRLVRDGTLWPTPMENGKAGVRESEIQRFFERAGKVAQGCSQ